MTDNLALPPGHTEAIEAAARGAEPIAFTDYVRSSWYAERAKERAEIIVSTYLAKIGEAPSPSPIMRESDQPIAHLVWLQGRRAPDDVEDYYQVARPGDKSVDGSDPFPVFGEPARWQDDPSSDERWNAGLDYGMTQLCNALKVDPQDVAWDAATETLDGDVRAVLLNILRQHFGEDWGPSVRATSEASE